MATLYANPTVLNSLTSPTTTSIRANVTTPNDVNYATSIFYYKERGSTVWISAGEGIPTSNTTDDFDITGLTEGSNYELYCVGVNTSDLQSVPSAIYTVMAGTVSDELDLFLTNLKTILSKSATFQSITSSANEAAALAFIFKEWVDDTDATTFPHAIVSEVDTDTEVIAENTRLSNATMSITITDETSVKYETRDSAATLSAFRVNMGKIKNEIMQLQGVSSNLRIEKMGYIRKPMLGEREDATEVMEVEFYVETGF